MAQDKYSAVWVSHTSISDFVQCPRAYFLKHIYRDPKTGHKIKIMSAPLALGQVVHEVIESLSTLPVEQRFQRMLMERYDEAWKNVTGKRGGFMNIEDEDRYKRKGREMISRVNKNPGPLVRKAVKIKEELPYYWLSEEDNIILCGKIDWLEYIPENDSVHIIDFKTSKYDEDENSLQLPIYYLLVTNTQKRTVEKASYWYLERNDELTPKELPDEKTSFERVIDVARQMKAARQLKIFTCPSDGCRSCTPYEKIINGEGEIVFVDTYKTDVYIMPPKDIGEGEEESVIL
ncbi:PD-(D/E)XK nuclease family protein [Candidatus Woesebacteria bacterium]|nr:PD-(D/E)XK nuclease family protein [Candidatus Woesebacteria bacterium]